MFKAYRVLRFFRVLISVAVCLVAAFMLAAFLWADSEGHATHRAAAPLFLTFFLAPATATIICTFSAVLFAIDQFQGRRRRLAALGETELGRGFWVWPVVSLLGALSGFINLFAGAFFIFLLLYWLMTGRLEGGPGWSLRNFRATRWDEKLSLVFVGFLALSWFKNFVIWAWVSAFPAALGVPEYAVRFEREMTGQTKVALRRFPDGQACLVEGARASHRPDLLRMDWDRIVNGSEAKVCMFRLLSLWGEVEDAEEWLEAQGFRVRNGYSSADPYLRRDGALHVVGYWSVKNYGPRFPTSGPIRRTLRALPYSMSVGATYSNNGSRLMYLRVEFSTV